MKFGSFNVGLLSRPWVSIEMDGRHMEVLWATSTKNMWLELTVLGFICVLLCGYEKSRVSEKARMMIITVYSRCCDHVWY